MVESDKHYAPVALNPEPIEYEAGWAPEQVCTFRRKVCWPCRSLTIEKYSIEDCSYFSGIIMVNARARTHTHTTHTPHTRVRARAHTHTYTSAHAHTHTPIHTHTHTRTDTHTQVVPWNCAKFRKLCSHFDSKFCTTLLADYEELHRCWHFHIHIRLWVIILQ